MLRHGHRPRPQRLLEHFILENSQYKKQDASNHINLAPIKYIINPSVSYQQRMISNVISALFTQTFLISFSLCKACISGAEHHPSRGQRTDTHSCLRRTSDRNPCRPLACQSNQWMQMRLRSCF